MELKKALDRVLSSLSADAEDGLKTAVTDAIAAGSMTLNKITALNKECQMHREEKEDVAAKLEKANSRIAELEGAHGSDELETYKAKAEKYDALIAEQETKTLTEWETIEKELGEITETDKRYDKVKGLLAELYVAGEGEKLSAEQAKLNIKLYQVAKLGGVLAVPEGKDPVPPPGKGKVGENKEYDPLDREAGFQTMLSNIRKEE